MWRRSGRGSGRRPSAGRQHAGHVITAHVADTTITIDLGDGHTTLIPRATTTPIRNIKADRPQARSC